MIVLASLTYLLQASLFPKDAPYSDRAGFHAAMAKISTDMPASQVRKILGTPDDVIRKHEELGGYTADEIWCYGTDRHLGVATLGRVFIVKGKVYWTTRRDPSASVDASVPEAQLRELIRKIDGQNRRSYDATLWLVTTANALIDAGHTAAVVALRESSVEDAAWGDEHRADLMRLIFEVPNPPGYPRDAEPNFDKKELKSNFRRGPRFPMIVFDDIPFRFSLGAYIGTGGSPYAQVKDYERYPVRTKRLTPPDDPFKSCEDLIASDQWPFPDHSKADERFAIPYKENAGDAMRQVLELVFDVYQPVDYRSEHAGNGLDIPKFHRGF